MKILKKIIFAIKVLLGLAEVIESTHKNFQNENDQNA